MEVNMTALELALLCFGVTFVGFMIGWFVAALMTCAKIDDLERELYKRELMLHEGKQ